MSGLAPKHDPPLTTCPLCGSERIVAYDRDMRGAHIARCRACGVKFMNPQYTDEYLADYYASYIDEGLDGRSDAEFRIAQKTQNLALIEQFVPTGRFFSVGCGDGVELKVAKARGWSVEGYDVDPVTTARVAKQVEAPVYSGDLFSLPLASDAYCCVYLDQVLEHPKRPGDLLRLCHRLLMPQGVLYLGVPNIDSLASSVKTALGRAGLKRRRRGRHYDSFHHLFYYSPRTLPRLLEERYDFEVLHVQGDPKPVARPSGVRRIRDALNRRVPALDSSFVVIARRKS